MIRKAIHDHMILNGMSAQDVADLCDISVNTVHNILSGKTHNPNIDTCVMIAKGLGISLDFIAGLKFAQKIVDDPTPTEKMPPIAQPPIATPEAPTKCLHHNEITAMYERSLNTKDKWLRILFCTTAVLLLAIVALVVFGVPCRH